MHTELQSAILAALRVRHPEAMTDVQIWAATGGYEYGGHSLSCAIACLQLLQQGQIELVEDGKRWKLADTGTPVPESHLGEIVGTEAGAGRKLLPLSKDPDAPLREATESSQSGHGFAPSPAHSGETGSCGDNLHAFQPHAERAVILPAGLSDFDCGGVKRISRQAHNLEITGSTPVPATSSSDVPQSSARVAAESDAGPGLRKPIGSIDPCATGPASLVHPHCFFPRDEEECEAVQAELIVINERWQ